MVKENAGTSEKIITFPVVHGDEVTVNLGRAIGAAGIEGCLLTLWAFGHLSEHLAAGSLIEPDFSVQQADCLQNSSHSHGGEFTRQYRLFPRGWNERLSG